MTRSTDRGHGRENTDFGPYLQRYLAGDGHALESLPERERDLALALAPAFESERHHDDDPAESGAPARQHDPIAIALGLVPGPSDVLSAGQLKRARQRARLNLKELVDLLQQRGWDVTATQVLGWHSSNTAIGPALINAIANSLHVPARTLRGAAAHDRVVDASVFLSDAIIERYLTDWAEEVGQDPAAVRKQAQRTLASLNFRNRADVSRDDVLAILRALRRIDPGGAGV